MIGYKVVSIKDGRLASYMTAKAFYGWTYYDIGKWTRRKKGFGPLALFDTPEHAEDSGCLHEDTRLYKCEYKESKVKGLWCKGDLVCR